MRLLLIEDDRPIARGIQSSLEQAGFTVDMVHDGIFAEQALTQNRHELVILDLGLPGLSGLQVLSHLKRDRQLGDVPVVVATSDGDLETPCREAGCAAWIAKPFGPTELLRVLTAIVHGADEGARARPS